MARGLPFTYGPSRTAPKSSTARAMGVLKVNEINNKSEQLFLKIFSFNKNPSLCQSCTRIAPYFSYDRFLIEGNMIRYIWQSC